MTLKLVVDNEENDTPPSWSALRAEAAEWAETFERATDRPTVSFEEIYCWGVVAGRDHWESQPLDMPRQIAIEMMRWLEAKAPPEKRKYGRAAG
jgi:hypothetical protein